MSVLIACEKSGVIRRAFVAAGHNAISVDIEPGQGPSGGRYGEHVQMDIFKFLSIVRPGDFQLMIAHPECRYLCSSGLFRNKGNPEREALTAQALDFALRLWDAPIERKCMENSIGRLTRTMRERGYRVQIVQPYQFGDDASKETGLILHNLPDLSICPELRHPGRVVIHNGKLVERWANQTDSGQNRLSPSPDRSAKRAETYPGIGNAMVREWGPLLQFSC